MTDTPWRDAYDDPEGMACALDRLSERLLEKSAIVGGCEDVDAAAACIRELAERIAELETPPHDEGAECGETHRSYDPGPAPAPAPEGEAARLRDDVRTLVRTYSASLPVGFRAAIGMRLADRRATTDAIPLPGQPAPEQEGLRARLMDAMEAHSVLIEKHDGEGERAVYMGDLENIVSDALIDDLEDALEDQPAPEQEGEALRTALRIAAQVTEDALERHREGVPMEDDWELLTHYDLLAPVRVTEPCAEEGCGCVEMLTEEEIAEGWECWRATDLSRQVRALTPERPGQEGGGA